MNTSKETEKELKSGHYSLILFVVEYGVNSKRAHENLKKLCSKWLPGRHRIKVVDVVEDIETALDYNIFITPSVVVEEPIPKVTIHGDLSDPQKFIEALNLDEKENEDG